MSCTKYAQHIIKLHITSNYSKTHYITEKFCTLHSNILSLIHLMYNKLKYDNQHQHHLTIQD